MRKETSERFGVAFNFGSSSYVSIPSVNQYLLQTSETAQAKTKKASGKSGAKHASKKKNIIDSGPDSEVALSKALPCSAAKTDAPSSMAGRQDKSANARKAKTTANKDEAYQELPQDSPGLWYQIPALLLNSL